VTHTQGELDHVAGLSLLLRLVGPILWRCSGHYLCGLKSNSESLVSHSRAALIVANPAVLHHNIADPPI
jgi:hypothetical protein